MKRLLAVTFLAATIAHPAYGDVTIKQTTGGKGLGVSGKAAAVTYIKGNKMRSEVSVGDRTQTTIFDLDAQKMYIFDSKKKEAAVWDMAAFAEEVSRSVDASSMKASLKPNGNTREISGRTAAGYDLEISMEAAMAGSKDMIMTITMSGPLWIVKNAPGTADYVRFYKGAVEKGWIFTDPRAAKAQPGQAKAMAEMYRKMAETGGIAYETDMQIKITGSGPVAGMLSRFGNMSFSSAVDSIETGPLPDELFAPPPDYKLKPNK